jgi:hypothetical protein
LNNFLKNLLKDNVSEKFYKIIKLFYNRINFFEIIYHVFRYYGLIKIDYSVKKKINFGSVSSNIFFTRKIKNTKIYLEYGSGSSTLFVNDYCNKNIDFKYVSVDSDRDFYNFLKKKNNKKKLLFIQLRLCIFLLKTNFIFFTKIFLKEKSKNLCWKSIRVFRKREIISRIDINRWKI